jgi:hypothetical protein
LLSPDSLSAGIFLMFCCGMESRAWFIGDGKPDVSKGNARNYGL